MNGGQYSVVRRWTEKEVEYLQTRYGNVGLPQMCKRLRRSKCSVMLKAKRLGLAMYKGRSGITAREAAKALGIDNKTVSRWVKTGNLKGRRVLYGNGKRCFYSIEIDDVWAFLDKNRKRINLSRYDGSLIPEPEWVAREVAKCKETPKAMLKVSKEERNAIIKMRHDGADWEDIARTIGRSTPAVQSIFWKYFSNQQHRKEDAQWSTSKAAKQTHMRLI